MLPGTVLEIFRTPLLHNQPRDDDHSDLPLTDNTNFECDSRYMLCESIHLELGTVPNHYMDFAYTSVLQNQKSAETKSASSTAVEVELIEEEKEKEEDDDQSQSSTCNCLLYTSPSPRDLARSRMPSSA